MLNLLISSYYIKRVSAIRIFDQAFYFKIRPVHKSAIKTRRHNIQNAVVRIAINYIPVAAKLIFIIRDHCIVAF